MIRLSDCTLRSNGSGCSCHPFSPLQVRWTKTAGGASERQGDSSLHETLKIENISRHQGGRYYCKAENGLGSPAIHSIRVDVYCKHTRHRHVHTDSWLASPEAVQ